MVNGGQKVKPCSASIKIARIKDPNSFGQRIKKKKKQINMMIAAVCLLLIISYVAQITNWIFSLEIPLIGISFRTIFTIAAIYYVSINREQLMEFIQSNQRDMKRRFGLFSEMSEKEGFDKFRVLRKHSEEKAKLKEQQRLQFLKL